MNNQFIKITVATLTLLWGLQGLSTTQTTETEEMMPDPYTEVQQLLDSGNLKQAEAALEKIGADNPIDWASHNILGSLALSKGRYKEAEQHYMNAIDANATQAEIYNNLGVLKLKTSEGQKALEYFLLALQMDPNNAQALYNMAEIYLTKGNPQEGLQYLRKVITVDPTNTKAQFKLIGYYLTLEEYAKAETQCNTLLKTFPNDPNIRADLGFVLFSYEAYDAAAVAFADAIQIDEKMERALYGLGLTAYRLSQYVMAEKVLQKVVAQRDDNVDYYIDLALAQLAHRTPEGLKAALATGKQVEALLNTEKLDDSSRSRAEKLLAHLQEIRQ